jgi:hypothetical protein
VSSRALRLTVVALIAIASACAKPRVELPSGPFVPLVDAQTVLAEAFGHCSDIDTLTLELALSGRAGGRKLRARLLAGLTASDAIRLEAVAPFGPPGFILAGTGQGSVLLLPRDDRVLRDVPPREILEALAGVEVEPRELLAFLSGCPAATPQLAGARASGSDWVLVDLESHRGVAYVRRRSSWRLAALVHQRLRVTFEDWTAHQPGLIRLQSTAAGGPGSFDLALRPSQVERNVALPASAFSVDVPPDAQPITIEELRRAGPMRDAHLDDRAS